MVRVTAPKKKTSADQTVATICQEALRGAAAHYAVARSTVKIDDILTLFQRLTGRSAAFLGADGPVKRDAAAVRHGCCAGVNECSDPSNTDWNTMIAAKTQHLGTVTHNANGWPFRCVEPQDCTAKVEPNDIVGVRASSGDLESNADDFGFAYEKLAEDPQHWQMDAFVSSAGSRTNPWAKGCLMSRQSLEPGSAYFAVCRPDLHILRVQYRTAKGGNTEIYESPIDPASNAPFVRLAARPGVGATCFGGLMGDGDNFPDGYSTRLEGTFPFRGLAVSSHGAPPAQMLFGQITLSSAGDTIRLPAVLNCRAAIADRSTVVTGSDSAA